jgi:hypothetical protein
MRELKKCPFCGSVNVFIFRHVKDTKPYEYWSDRFTVLCSYEDGGCGCESGHYKSIEEAIASWDRREA